MRSLSSFEILKILSGLSHNLLTPKLFIIFLNYIKKYLLLEINYRQKKKIVKSKNIKNIAFKLLFLKVFRNFLKFHLNLNQILFVIISIIICF